MKHMVVFITSAIVRLTSKYEWDISFCVVVCHRKLEGRKYLSGSNDLQTDTRVFMYFSTHQWKSPKRTCTIQQTQKEQTLQSCVFTGRSSFFYLFLAFLNCIKYHMQQWHFCSSASWSRLWTMLIIISPRLSEFKNNSKHLVICQQIKPLKESRWNNVI